MTAKPWIAPDIARSIATGTPAPWLAPDIAAAIRSKAPAPWIAPDIAGDIIEDAPGGDAAVAPSNSAAPSISGTAAIGQTLTCDPGTWDGTAPIDYAYQWKVSGGADIGGATASTFVLTSAQFNKQIVCTVTASNTAGSASAATDPTSAVTGTKSYVQGKLHANGASSVDNVSVTFDAAVQSHSSILVSVGFASGTGAVSSITDDKGNTYGLLDSTVTSDSSYTWATAIATDVANAPSMVTATLDGAHNFVTIMIDEVAYATAVRSHAAHTSNGIGNGTDAVTSTSVAAQIGDFVYGSAVDASSTGIHPGTGFTMGQLTSSTFISEYKTAAGTTVAATFTADAGDVSDNLVAAVVVLH